MLAPHRDDFLERVGRFALPQNVASGRDGGLRLVRAGTLYGTFQNVSVDREAESEGQHVPWSSSRAYGGWPRTHSQALGRANFGLEDCRILPRRKLSFPSPSSKRSQGPIEGKYHSHRRSDRFRDRFQFLANVRRLAAQET